jgi:hypothetical protein
MEDQNQTDKNDKAVEKDDEYAGVKLSQITGFREMLEAAAKVLVGISVLSYIIGLLITNMHLRNYGAFHLSFTQFEYVLTGLLWLFLVGLAYLAYITTTNHFSVEPKASKWKWWGYNVGGLLVYFVFGIATLYFPLMFLSNYEIDVFSWRAVYISVSLILAPIIIDGVGKRAYRFFQAAKQRTLPRDAVDTLVGIILVLASLTGYASSVYPNLSPVYGGGKPQKIILVAKPDQVTQLKNLGINVNSENRQIGPLEIIYESGDYLILSTPEEIKERKNIQSIRLKKDMFDAILHVDNKYVKAVPVPSPTTSPNPAPTQTPQPSPSPTVDSRKSPTKEIP